MRAIFIIGKLTFKESVYGRVFFALLVFLVLFLLLCAYLSTLAIGNVSRVIENSGMLGQSLVCLLVTILFGLFSLYQEKERNELYVILNRISRTRYLLGRFMGVGLVLILFSGLTGAGIVMVNGLMTGKTNLLLGLAVYMSVLEFSLLLAFGILFFTLQVTFFLNAFLTLSLYFLGHSFYEAIQSFIGLGRFGHSLHLKGVQALSYLFPNFDLFSFRLAIVHEQAIPATQILLVTGYWILYVAAVLSAAVAVIRRNDL